MFRLEVYYRMDDNYLRSMVHARIFTRALWRRNEIQPFTQLTDPVGLASGFSDVEIDDYPVTARIYIKEDIDVAQKGLRTFKQMRSVERDILSEYDPRNAWKVAGLLRERHELRRKLLQENPQEALREITILLRPTKFLTYLKLEETNFKLHRCQWGMEKMEMPDSVFLPENMEVVVRTDQD